MLGVPRKIFHTPTEPGSFECVSKKGRGTREVDLKQFKTSYSTLPNTYRLLYMHTNIEDLKKGRGTREVALFYLLKKY